MQQKKKRVTLPLFHAHQAAAGEWTCVYVFFHPDVSVVTAKNNRTSHKHSVASVYAARNVKKKPRANPGWSHDGETNIWKAHPAVGTCIELKNGPCPP